ncbi:MAG: extracellular solute-binding protein [Chloroflexota bacterium]
MRKPHWMTIGLCLLVSLVLAACPAPGAAPAPAGGAEGAEESSDDSVAAAPADGDRVQVRWFIGLGTGSGEGQPEQQDAIIERFNESQDRIELIPEYVPNASARDTLSTQIASGNGPDLIGPVGWGGSNAFAGQYLDLTDLIELSSFDTSQINPALVDMYQSEDGKQVGLPFLVFPASVFYQRELFDEAGLNYPPTSYGDKYVMPTGVEVDWNYDTLTEIARILTVDANGNDASMGEFDGTNIVQYGFTFQWQTALPYIGSYISGAGSMAGDDGQTSTIPDGWVDAWSWWHDAMWGDAPFAPTGPVIQSPEFGSGNVFSSQKIAIAISPSWYTCCIADAGEAWDLAALPTGLNGEVNGRIDADTFRILSDTEHPNEAFEVLQFLLTDAAVELAGIYGGMPARPDQAEEWFAAKANQFPFVENWDVVNAGLAYPDVPSAEASTPNWNETWDRVATLENLILNEADIDIAGEAATLLEELQTIFEK